MHASYSNANLVGGSAVGRRSGQRALVFATRLVLLCIFAAITTAAAAVVAAVDLPFTPDRLESHQNARANVELDGAQFDFVVIGAGVAGPVVANRLSRNERVRVLLLEAGPSDNHINFRIPTGGVQMFNSPYDWSFRSEPEEGLLGRSQFFPRGKVLGGTGNFNIQIYNRGLERTDYDRWVAMGNPGWSYEDVLPYYKRLERNQRAGICTEAHGTDGEWSVSDQFHVFNSTRLMYDAWRNYGLPEEADQSAGPGHANGVNILQVSLQNGARHSTVDAMLSEQVLARPNLHVQVNAHAHRLLFDAEKRVVGVEFNVTQGANAGVKTVRVGKEVVLSAGAFGSPQLLMLSGVGPRDHLAEVGVSPLVHHLPGVGENLQDHTQVGVTMSTTKLETFESYAQNQAGADAFARWLLAREGPLTAVLGQLQAYFKTKYAENDAVDVHSLFAPTIFILDGMSVRPGLRGMSSSSLLMRPESTGHVRLATASPYDHPRIKHNCYKERIDLLRVVEGVKTLREVYKQAPIAQYLDEEIVPGADVQTDEQIEEYVRKFSISGYHHTSTCKMGPSSDDMAVVDAQLRVHGLRGVRVMDASIMPKITSGNPQAAIAMIAEKGSQAVIDEYDLQCERAESAGVLEHCPALVDVRVDANTVPL